MLCTNSTRQKLENELLSVAIFKFLPKSIQSLEAQGLPQREQLKILHCVKENLKRVYLERLNKSLEKNPDLVKLTDSEDYAIRQKCAYAPLTTVDVERSFSTYKNILSDRRHNLS